MKQRSGFTILEMSIILAIIGILVILLTPNVSNWYDEILVQTTTNKIASDINYAKRLEIVNYPKVYSGNYYFEFYPSTPPYKSYEIYHYIGSSNKIVDKHIDLKHVECTAFTTNNNTVFNKIRFNRFNEAIFYNGNSRVYGSIGRITVKKGEYSHYIEIVYLTAGVTVK